MSQPQRRYGRQDRCETHRLATAAALTAPCSAQLSQLSRTAVRPTVQASVAVAPGLRVMWGKRANSARRTLRSQTNKTNNHAIRCYRKIGPSVPRPHPSPRASCGHGGGQSWEAEPRSEGRRRGRSSPVPTWPLLRTGVGAATPSETQTRARQCPRQYATHRAMRPSRRRGKPPATGAETQEAAR